VISRKSETKYVDREASYHREMGPQILYILPGGIAIVLPSYKLNLDGSAEIIGAGSTMCTHNNCIYVFGGMDDERSEANNMWRWDLNTEDGFEPVVYRYPHAAEDSNPAPVSLSLCTSSLSISLLAVAHSPDPTILAPTLDISHTR